MRSLDQFEARGYIDIMPHAYSNTTFSLSGSSGTALSLLTRKLHKIELLPLQNRCLLALGTRKSSIKIRTLANTKLACSSVTIVMEGSKTDANIVKCILQRRRLV
jgi:hypothetical protein